MMTGVTAPPREQDVPVEGGRTVTVATNWTKSRHNDGRGKREGYVWLRGVGYCKARPLEACAEGDILAWDYGSTSRLVELRRNEDGEVIGVREAWVTSTGMLRVLDRRRRGDMLTVVAT